MEAFLNLIYSFVDLLDALLTFLVSICAIVWPKVPLLAWIAFWMLAVNWISLRKILLQGGWIGLALLGFSAILIWGTVAPPAGGQHYIFGLTVDNFTGKTVYVTSLICIMLLSGAVQLSGCCNQFLKFPEEIEPESQDTHASAH